LMNIHHNRISILLQKVLARRPNPFFLFFKSIFGFLITKHNSKQKAQVI